MRSIFEKYFEVEMTDGSIEKVRMADSFFIDSNNNLIFCIGEAHSTKKFNTTCFKNGDWKNVRKVGRMKNEDEI